MAKKKQKKRNPKEKGKLHPRNKHQGRYNLKELIITCPALAPFIIINEYEEYQNETIDFANPEAVKTLNKALLEHYYDVRNWDIPAGYLCPPIPGRSDYIHHIADLLASSNQREIPKGNQIKCLDIGVGANCVYPLIGNHEYKWNFIGSDIDPMSIESATAIVNANAHLKASIKFRLQPNHRNIFSGVLEKTERFEVSICNPPFHASLAEATAATLKKLNNLSDHKVTEATLNFGGQNRELWCHGGEGKFVSDMITQSKEFAKSCLWFTTLISNQAHLKSAYNQLEKIEAVDVKTIPMGQGNKISRILAWSFHTPEEQTQWMSKKKVQKENDTVITSELEKEKALNPETLEVINTEPIPETVEENQTDAEPEIKIKKVSKAKTQLLTEPESEAVPKPKAKKVLKAKTQLVPELENEEVPKPKAKRVSKAKTQQVPEPEIVKEPETEAVAKLKTKKVSKPKTEEKEPKAIPPVDL